MSYSIPSLLSPITPYEFYKLEKGTEKNNGWLHLIQERSNAEQLFQAVMAQELGKTKWDKLHPKSDGHNELTKAVEAAVRIKQHFFVNHLHFITTAEPATEYWRSSFHIDANSFSLNSLDPDNTTLYLSDDNISLDHCFVSACVQELTPVIEKMVKLEKFSSIGIYHIRHGIECLLEKDNFEIANVLKKSQRMQSLNPKTCDHIFVTIYNKHPNDLAKILHLFNKLGLSKKLSLNVFKTAYTKIQPYNFEDYFKAACQYGLTTAADTMIKTNEDGIADLQFIIDIIMIILESDNVEIADLLKGADWIKYLSTDSCDYILNSIKERSNTNTTSNLILLFKKLGLYSKLSVDATDAAYEGLSPHERQRTIRPGNHHLLLARNSRK
jgi:hypothetical protein